MPLPILFIGIAGAMAIVGSIEDGINGDYSITLIFI